MAKPNPFRELTDQIAVPLEQIAEAVGRTYGTVQAYRAGAREAPPEVFGLLAEFLEKRQEQMPELIRAARLRSEADT